MPNVDALLDALRDGCVDGARIAEWSLHAAESRSLTLGVRDRQVGSPHTPLTVAEGLAASYLLVWSDGRVSRGSLERSQLDAGVGPALRRARAAAYDDPDAARVAGPAKIAEVELHAEPAAVIAGGDAAPLIRRLEAARARVRDHGLSTWSGSLSATETSWRVVTSAGLDVRGPSTSSRWFVSFDGELGDGFAARTPEPEREFGERLERLVERVLALRRPGHDARAGTLPVLLHPQAVERWVLDTLLHSLRGSVVAHGEGHFRREQFGSGDAVLREDLGLRLDPLLPLRSGSYRVTGEGVPAARCRYVERGRLVRPLLDLKYARRLGLDPTPLPRGADTLFLEGPEPLSPEAAAAHADGGVLVLSVLGVHTQDAASGDFSLSAPQSLLIRSGRCAGRMRCTISGNLFAVFRDERLRFVRFPGEHTPGLLFPCRVEPR